MTKFHIKDPVGDHDLGVHEAGNARAAIEAYFAKSEFGSSLNYLHSEGQDIASPFLDRLIVTRAPDDEFWLVVRRSDGTPDMFVVAYSLEDCQQYLPLLIRELSSGKSVEPVRDPALLARLVAASDAVDDLDGVWITDIAHAWHSESGFSHAHN